LKGTTEFWTITKNTAYPDIVVTLSSLLSFPILSQDVFSKLWRKSLDGSYCTFRYSILYAYVLLMLAILNVNNTLKNKKPWKNENLGHWYSIYFSRTGLSQTLYSARVMQISQTKIEKLTVYLVHQNTDKPWNNVFGGGDGVWWKKLVMVCERR